MSAYAITIEPEPGLFVELVSPAGEPVAYLGPFSGWCAILANLPGIFRTAAAYQAAEWRPVRIPDSINE